MPDLAYFEFSLLSIKMWLDIYSYEMITSEETNFLNVFLLLNFAILFRQQNEKISREGKFYSNSNLPKKLIQCFAIQIFFFGKQLWTRGCCADFRLNDSIIDLFMRILLKGKNVLIQSILNTYIQWWMTSEKKARKSSVTHQQQYFRNERVFVLIKSCHKTFNLIFFHEFFSHLIKWSNDLWKIHEEAEQWDFPIFYIYIHSFFSDATTLK